MSLDPHIKDGEPEPGTIQGDLARAELLCRRARYADALEILDDLTFREGFDLESSYGGRFRSHYGLCLALVFGQVSRGERLCREALEVDGFSPDLAHNLGLVYLRCRRRDLAFKAFDQVKRVAPRHHPTTSVIRKLGERRPPLFPFLHRSHPLNKYSGMMIHRARRIFQSRQSSVAA